MTAKEGGSAAASSNLRRLPESRGQGWRDFDYIHVSWISAIPAEMTTIF
jgi:hypothetical protein